MRLVLSRMMREGMVTDKEPSINSDCVIFRTFVVSDRNITCIDVSGRTILVTTKRYFLSATGGVLACAVHTMWYMRLVWSTTSWRLLSGTWCLIGAFRFCPYYPVYIRRRPRDTFEQSWQISTIV